LDNLWECRLFICFVSSVPLDHVTLNSLTVTILSDLHDATEEKQSHAVSVSNFDLVIQYVGWHLIFVVLRYPGDRYFGFFRSMSTNCRIFTYSTS